MAARCSLGDLPVELFLDGIFPLLPVADLLHLGSTNRFFSNLVNDEAYWHRRIQEDFNFSGSDTARKTGWKFLYKRLSHPQVYVWGEKSQSRLGLIDTPKTAVRDGVPYPVRLDIPGVRIVSLVAGGMSFHAIDSRGDVYVWGVLNGETFALRSDGFAEPGQKADTPMKLSLPTKFRSLSCGRLHTTGLDASSQVWTFTSWGRPFLLQSSLVDKSSPETTPIQVESGWSFSTILTQSGDVLVFWPFGGRMKSVIDRKDEELNGLTDATQHAAAKAQVNENSPRIIPCHWWVLEGADPVRLPPIPSHDLPELGRTGLSTEELEEETKLVKIAGIDNCVIGLTNKGHLLRYDRLGGEEAYRQGRWEYLPYFSDIEKLQEHAVYRAVDGNDAPQLTPPETMHINHISGSFQTFFAYSTGPSSVVLMGKATDSSPQTTMPTIIPELQDRAVISVVLGDYHYGALTGTGQLLTWGAFSKGALGLGDPTRIAVGEPGGYADNDELRTSVNSRFGIMRPPPDVRVPTEVRFDHGQRRKREKYCFGAAALGWHTGALVIDLDVRCTLYFL
ncbi:RCC1/BLIP-II [Trametes versicolor FP-101664 SS1]|uniref:RCC1/BLIP-II n=1 Tax=Trametes versicolor (strain FP-101664) TaxID=717944 RepID=UPI0004621A6B|nr:RCC1/BLIP-II [Trametes versicolor FP-101664 SS1]EIW58164.1 RCC1/BLIP-II [Trametes versicolor FP-101664 SS1]